LMPEMGTKPVNKYLPPRPKDRDRSEDVDILAPFLEPIATETTGFLGWLDKALDAMPGASKNGGKS
jgi:hypothetical protein